LILVAQPGLADDKAALTARLQSVEAVTSLDAAGVKPWHLKIHAQLFDAKGNPAEQGDIEEWWAAPDQYLISYSLPSYTGKLLHNADGVFRTAGIGVPPMAVAMLLEQAVHPMPRAEDVAASEPLLRKETVGGIPLDCIMISQPQKGIPVEPLGLYPTYCLDAAKNALLATYELGTIATVQNSVGLFQKLTVATSFNINIGPTKMAEGKLTMLSGLKPEPAQFAKSDGFEPAAKLTPVDATFMNDQGLMKMPPVYPAAAKSKHMDGAVVLNAVIGRDGHVLGLKLKSAEDADLALSALYTVRQWTYKPFLVNGKPVDVDTTITVRFQYRGK
jgi:TonB family protein